MPQKALSPEDDAAWPAGSGVAWDPAAAHLDDGAVVVGGVPRRLVRLSRTARREVHALAGDRSHRVSAAVAARLVRPLLDAGILHPVPGRAALGPEAVTVVVPARDRAEALRRLLPGLAGFARIVVVDDGSTDDTGAIAAGLGAEVVRRDRAGGPAAARNAGLEHVGTALVAFIDSDIRLEPGWEGPVLAHFNDPTVAVAAPRVKGDAATRTDPLARYEIARSPQDLGPHPGYVRSGNRVSFLPAAVLVARTEVVRAHGGFDADLVVGEDVDFVWRLAAAGWRIRYEPAAVTYHEARPDLSRLLRRRIDYGTSAAALDRRHPGRVAPIGVSPWSIAVWGAALLGRPRIAALLAAATALRLGEALRGKVHERWRAARLVAAGGHLGAARILASAISRTWLPLALIAMKWRRPRAALAAFLVVPPLADWLERRPPIDPAAYTLLHLADDAAYCTGVWLGCLRHRTAGPLLPRLYRQEPIFAGIEPAAGTAIASKASGSRNRDEEA